VNAGQEPLLFDGEVAIFLCAAGSAEQRKVLRSAVDEECACLAALQGGQAGAAGAAGS